MNSTCRCPSTRPISPSQNLSRRPRGPVKQLKPVPRHEAQQSLRRPGTPNPRHPKKPKKVRLTPGERKARAAGERRKLKVLGLCKDCRQHAIPGQTRCPDCAEKHRQSRRRQRQAQRQAKQISSLGVFERLAHPSNSIQAPKRNTELSSLRLWESGSAQEANAGVNSDSPIS